MSSANSYATIVKREPHESDVLILAFATPQKELAKTYLSPRLIVALSRNVYGLIRTLRQAICTTPYIRFVRLRTYTYTVGSNYCGTPCGADRLPGVDAVHRLFGQRTGAAVSDSDPARGARASLL